MSAFAKAILFDLDGTLIDSTAVVERLWKTWAERNGVDAAELLAVSHGRPAHQTVRMFAPHLDAHEEARAHVALEEQDTAGVVALPGTLDLLGNLPVERWAIVTSCPRNLALIRLRAAGVPVPGLMVTADDVRTGKPDPEPYLRAAEKLGVTAEECLVVEDAPAGIESALGAGMRVLALGTTHSPEALQAEWIVPDLSHVQVEACKAVLHVTWTEPHSRR